MPIRDSSICREMQGMRASGLQGGPQSEGLRSGSLRVADTLATGSPTVHLMTV